MYIISKDKKFKIYLPKQLYDGDDLRGQTIYVHITLQEGKRASFYDLGIAVRECLAPYDVNYRHWAPNLHVFAHIREKTYEFNIDWEMDSRDYVIEIVNQFIF